MDKKKFIKENWGNKSIAEMIDILSISLKEFLEIAFELQLYKKIHQISGEDGLEKKMTS